MPRQALLYDLIARQPIAPWLAVKGGEARAPHPFRSTEWTGRFRWQGLRPRLQQLAGTLSFPQLLLRLGYPLFEVAGAPRRPVNETVQPADDNTPTPACDL